MRIDIDKRKMTISEVDRVTSENAPAFEQEIFKKTDHVDRIVFDADGLTYISSAGLRVLLKLKKKYDISVINVSPEVFNILETTGFTEMMSVKRKRRRIDVDGCQVIGRGSRGTVYKIEEDTAVKVFGKEFDLSAVEKERELTRNALIAGIPTMIPFDIAECKDSYAIIYELVSGQDYTEAIKREPEKREEYIRDYSRFVKEINSILLPPEKFRSQKAACLDILSLCKEKCSKEEYALYYDMIRLVPDAYGFVHGDCHMKNIMTGDQDHMIIDLEGCGYGHYFFELIAICCDYKLPGLPLFEGMKDFVVEMIMGFHKVECLQVWNTFFKEYMGDRSSLEDLDEMCTVYAYLRHTLHAMLHPMLAPDHIIKRMQKYIWDATGGDPGLNRYRELFKEL